MVPVCLVGRGKMNLDMSARESLWKMVIFTLRSDEWEITGYSRMTGYVTWWNRISRGKVKGWKAWVLCFPWTCSPSKCVNRQKDWVWWKSIHFHHEHKWSEFEKAIGLEWGVSNVQATRRLRVEKMSWQSTGNLRIVISAERKGRSNFGRSGVGIEQTGRAYRLIFFRVRWLKEV